MPARQITPPSSPACCQHPPLCVPVCTRMGGCARGVGGVQTDVCAPPPPFLCSSRPGAPHPPLPHVQGFVPPPTSPRNRGILGGARKVCPPSPFSSSPPPLTPKIGQRVRGAGSSPPVHPLCAPLCMPHCAPPLCTPPSCPLVCPGAQKRGARTGGGVRACPPPPVRAPPPLSSIPALPLVVHRRCVQVGVRREAGCAERRCAEGVHGTGTPSPPALAVLFSRERGR